jgi:hypothetical protein
MLGKRICRGEKSLCMKALRDWVAIDSAMSLASGMSDHMQSHSTFASTRRGHRITKSGSRRPECQRDGAAPPLAASSLQRSPFGRMVSVTCHASLEQLHICPPTLGPRRSGPSKLEFVGSAGLVTVTSSHGGGPFRAGLFWLLADQPNAALVQSRVRERFRPLGDPRLHWPTSSKDPSFEEKL